MGSYMKKTLLPEETVQFETGLSAVIYVWPVILMLAGLGLGFWGMLSHPGFLWFFLLFGWGLYLFVVSLWRQASCEFAVSNRRVVAKIGIFSRKTLEMSPSKIESISVSQGFFGMIFNYGLVTIIGSGGTRETFPMIARPLDFRRAAVASA